MPQITEAHVCHQSKERLRVRIPSKKGDAAYFGELHKQLVHCKDVVKCEVNTLTGSVLFIHNSNVKAIAEYTQEHNLFTINAPSQNATGVYNQVTTSLSQLNDRFRSLTSGEVDLWDAAFLALLGNGLYQLARGNFSTLPWYSAFWYAFGVYKSRKGGGSGG